MTEGKLVYSPLKVELMEVGGICAAMEAMRLPKNTPSDTIPGGLGPEDAKRAGVLIRGGDDHAKALRGVVAWLKLEMQVGFMIEFETYRHGVECLSTSSSMHNELKDLKGVELAEQKQRDLPEKRYTRIITASYQALRNMYIARRYHRHPDWRNFCSFVETLPYFDELIFPQKGKI